MIRKNLGLLTLLGVLLATRSALAGGWGQDMWTEYFEHKGLYTPHENNCGGSESFISMGPGTSLGFCLEQSQRTAAHWEAARNTCAANGMRLPEPAEWKYACDNGSGLSDMTDDWEWVGNYAFTMDSNDTYTGTKAAMAGDGGCNYGSYANVAPGNGNLNSLTFRCLH